MLLPKPGDLVHASCDVSGQAAGPLHGDSSSGLCAAPSPSQVSRAVVYDGICHGGGRRQVWRLLGLGRHPRRAETLQSHQSVLRQPDERKSRRHHSRGQPSARVHEQLPPSDCPICHLGPLGPTIRWGSDGSAGEKLMFYYFVFFFLDCVVHFGLFFDVKHQRQAICGHGEVCAVLSPARGDSFEESHNRRRSFKIVESYSPGNEAKDALDEVWDQSCV